MLQAVPKPARTTPEQRKAERKSREYNSLKPPPKEKKPPKPLRCKAGPGRNSSLGVGKGTLKRNKPLLDHQRKRQAQKYWVTAGKHQLVKKQRKPLRLRSMTPAARERRRQDAIWSERVWSIWGSCILTGAVMGEFWPVDPHHCYDKSIRPAWRHETWNGILLRRDIHDMADTVPEFHEAMQRVADECRAAAEGRRPMPTRTEAREIIFRGAPMMRKYAAPEPMDY